MHVNQQLRESLVHQADAAYFGLMQQLDNLLGIIGFYMDRYPVVTPGDKLRQVELEHTVTLLGKLPTDLAEIIRRWKTGEPRLQTRIGIELFILNEIWANVQALVYFIKSQEMSLDPFEYEQSAAHFATVMRCNRLLT